MRRHRRRQVLRRGRPGHCSGVASRRLPRRGTGPRLCTGCLSTQRGLNSPSQVELLIAGMVCQVSTNQPK